LLAAALLMFAAPAPAAAQNDPNPGALTFAGGLDVPTLYVFRGIRQEVDPKITMWPYGDLGIALGSSDGAVKSVAVNLGIWNSLHTGSSGLDGADLLHYEEDFYAKLTLGFDRGFGLATTFTAYTSPNGFFSTVKEISFNVSKSGMIAPYALIAFELSDEGQADGGQFFGGKKGTYVELGVGPNWPLADGKATLTIPVKLGLSASNYYESFDTGDDNKLGFFDVGALVTVPLTRIPSQFGSWNIHGGADVLVFGDTTKALNVGTDGEAKKSKVIGLFGIGVSY
jgi:hypothetical protein